MSGPHDTEPPPSGPRTSPELPRDIVELPIRAGEASLTVVAAMSNLVAAIVAVEKVAMACARALDATATKEPTTP
jgi:hypothetical protein